MNTSDEAGQTRDWVGRHEWGPTEGDEAAVLEALGYRLDEAGIYRHADDVRGAA